MRMLDEAAVAAATDSIRGCGSIVTRQRVSLLGGISADGSRDRGRPYNSY